LNSWSPTSLMATGGLACAMQSLDSSAAKRCSYCHR
jgi:hypothetical protein